MLRKELATEWDEPHIIWGWKGELEWVKYNYAFLAGNAALKLPSSLYCKDIFSAAGNVLLIST